MRTILLAAAIAALPATGALAQGQVPGVIQNPGSGPIRNDAGRIPMVRQSPQNPNLYVPAPPPRVQYRIDRREQARGEREQRWRDRREDRFREEQFRDIYGDRGRDRRTWIED